ncbi:hypothetical protein KAI68_04220 [bacterium]|nr:hypothetical protein [bacterium]
MITFTSSRFYKERFYWISLVIVFMFLLFFVLLNNAGNKNKVIEIKHREKELVEEIEDMGDLLIQKEKLLNCQPQLCKWETERLKKKGLKDPHKDIIADLIKHRELIPYKGISGGTMKFYPETDIHVLTSRWVYASIDDGHISGQMLLKYKVSRRGKISWKVMDSYLGR